MNVNFQGSNVYASQQKQQNNTSLKSHKQDIPFKALNVHHEEVIDIARGAINKDPANNCLIQDAVQSVTVLLDTFREWGKVVDFGIFATNTGISEIEKKKQAEINKAATKAAKRAGKSVSGNKKVKDLIKKAKDLIKETTTPAKPSLAFYIAPLNNGSDARTLRYINLKQVTPTKVIKEIKPEIEKITGTKLPEVDIPPINSDVVRPKFSVTVENLRRAIKKLERDTKLDEVQDKINTLTAKKTKLTSGKKVKKEQINELKEIEEKIIKLEKEKEGYKIDARIDEIKYKMKPLETELESLEKKRK